MSERVIIRKDSFLKFLESLRMMQDKACYVGIPNEPRKDGDITNAQIAFIDEFGSDHKNIPARPFMIPAIKKIKDRIVALYKEGAKKAFGGEDIHITYEKAGMVARDAIKNEINDGNFTPLKPQTIAARQRARKSGQAGTKPLKDTGQLINSITYIIRGR